MNAKEIVRKYWITFPRPDLEDTVTEILDEIERRAGESTQLHGDRFGLNYHQALEEIRKELEEK